MKLSAYREALIDLADQAIADYDLRTMLARTDARSPTDGSDMIAFTERVNGVLDDLPQVMRAASLNGAPTPEFVDLSSLAGTNEYAGAPDARALESYDAPTTLAKEELSAPSPPSPPRDAARRPLAPREAPSNDDLVRMLKQVIRALEGRSASERPTSTS